MANVWYRNSIFYLITVLQTTNKNKEFFIIGTQIDQFDHFLSQALYIFILKS